MATLPGAPAARMTPVTPSAPTAARNWQPSTCSPSAPPAHHPPDGLPVAILRVSNPYGYTLPAGRQQGLIPHAIRCARSGQPLALWGDGSARKDFLHSEDFLRAISLAIARGIDGTFNLCRGESHTVAEVLSLIEQITGRRLALATAPAPAWDVHDSRLDGSKFAAATDWRPTMSLADGLRRSVAATIA
jgi:nucleoside-diphosphate-sugar epimerase